ncbi:MAG: M20/M25/M40 family metallo-hydrolase [Proteobacteria bacterium]|nr:M20/M25/M40 family metallo-hydrolase [Pseudomonadota bacterium]
MSASKAESQSGRAVALLAEFIGYRTENPTGDELALCERLARELEARGAERIEVVGVPRTDKSPGAYVFAAYGQPRTLLNVHVDTVPANTGWTRDPFQAEITDDRIYGLGSADTKGAIAAILVALDEVRPKNLGILFSGDEEAGSQVVDAFVKTEHIRGIERAIICEPTRRRAGVRHRGIRAYRADVRGRGGHSSTADHMPKPIVDMARLALLLDDLGRRHLDTGPEDMKGLCMNVAAIDGGVAFNVVPDGASLRWSVRPPPGFDSEALEQEQRELAESIGRGITLYHPIGHEPFACRDVDWYRELLGGFVDDFGPLDFWTEAAVFSAAGVDAIVVGPGDIAQAHAADEFVTREDLAWAVGMFTHVLNQCSR